MKLQRVAITGINAISGLGNNKEEFWKNLKSGKSGIHPYDMCGDSDLASFASRVKNLELSKDYFSGKDRAYLDLFTKYAVQATLDLLHPSGFFTSNKYGYSSFRIGSIIGVGMFGCETSENSTMDYHGGRKRNISYHKLSSMIPNSASAQISIKTGAKGVGVAVSGACASTMQAMEAAVHNIMLNKLDMAITGGADSTFSHAWYYGFSNLALTKYKGSDPNKACTPFDKNRMGTVFGEGAGIIILENYDKAKARGANIIGEIVGVHSTSDAFHSLAMDPSVEAPINAMRGALEMADLNPNKVDWVAAHAPGTPKGDVGEAFAINTVFDHNPLVTAFKSYFGHAMGASGALELIAMLLATKNGYVLPTLNLKNVDEECPLNHVTKLNKKKVNYVMKTALGFGGTNSSIVIKINNK